MSMNQVMVDGSIGEGGGQVLRASLALSMALGKPFQIKNIRSGRPKPGLKRQHLACILAASEICKANVTGGRMHSTELSFVPGSLNPGKYSFDIGSGGSCTLVLQALMPPLMFASEPSSLTITGGTHVPHAPPFEFLQQTLLPWLAKLGPSFTANMDRAGFMQVGGGSIDLEIRPAAPGPLNEQKCGALEGIEALIYICNLDENIAAREAQVIRNSSLNSFGLTDEDVSLETGGSMKEKPIGPGNAVLIKVKRANGVTICSGIGQRGLAAGSVARQAVRRTLAFIRSEVPVEAHLADQLIVPLALAGGGSFLTEKPSEHLKTCLDILSLFMDIKKSITQQSEQSYLVTLEK